MLLLAGGNLAVRGQIGKSTDLANRRDKSLKAAGFRPCAIMKLPTDLKHKVRPTRLRGAKATCNKFGQVVDVCGCLVTLPKPSHIPLLQAVTMRSFLTLVAMVACGSAQAQFPYNYAPYTPHYPPNGNQYDPPSQSRSPASMAQAMLDAHSAIRARVGVPPHVWSDQLAQVAQDWAIHLIATGALSHRPNNRYGENIYAIAGGHATPAEVVDLWAKEARGYDIVTIPAPACAGTIRRSSGPRHAPSAVLSPGIRSARSGSATTILQETSSGSDRTEQPKVSRTDAAFHWRRSSS